MFEKADQCFQQYGQKVAIQYLDEFLTYRDLSDRVNQVAHFLVSRGVTVETKVGLCIERGIDAVVSVLAILKLGATYIPIDPAYPQERIQFMMAEADPSHLLTQSHVLTHLPPLAAQTICLDREAEAMRQWQGQPWCEAQPPNALAYIMYTSGSTGKPKGVQVLRTNVNLYLDAISDVLSVNSADVYLHTASFSFSSSIRQLLVPLSYGATVILASQAQAKNPLALLELMKEHRVTVSDTVASVWRSVMQAVQSLDEDKKAALLHNSLRLVLLSGELTPCAVLQQIRQNLKSQPTIVNIYGQTETIGVCAYQVPPEFNQGEGYVPVGFPYGHNRVYILDEARQPVPQGDVGELYVSGGCLSQGYLNRPDLTDQYFLPNPWVDSGADRPDRFARLYKTGDLARQQPDGRLEIKGRTDFQVKLRGMRIELGEIEQVIEKSALAKEAIVLAKPDHSNEPRLVAYVVPSSETRDASVAPFAQRLKQELQQHLPDYLMPSLVVTLEKLPRTPNGKRDRLSLPAPDWSSLSSAGLDETTLDETEASLREIWTELLGFTPGVEDSFFDLGGHSLMAVQLFARLDSQFGCKLSFNHLLACPTIKQLAAYIRAGHTQDKSVILVPLRTEGRRPPLFCIHGIGGAALYYQVLLPYLPPDQPVYGIQAQGFDGVQEPLETVAAMASLYLNEIRQVYPEGPLYLIGHSFGGLIAHEMARQVQTRGETLGLLALVDTKTPKLAKTRPTVNVFLQTLLHNIWHTPAKERWTYLVESGQWFYKKRRIASDRDYAEHLKRQNAHLRMFNVLQPNYKAQAAYEPGCYQGTMVVFRALIQSPRSFKDRTLGWSEWVDGEIKVHTIPGDHLRVMEEPYVGVLAEAIRPYLGHPTMKEWVLLPESVLTLARDKD